MLRKIVLAILVLLPVMSGVLWAYSYRQGIFGRTDVRSHHVMAFLRWGRIEISMYEIYHPTNLKFGLVTTDLNKYDYPGNALGFAWVHSPRRPGRHDLSQSRLVVPFWFITSLLLIPPLIVWRRWRSKAAVGQCPSCGYDLRASPDRCPECGTVTAQPASAR